ncbi:MULTISPECIES: ATP-binding protein [unclassified Bradyrhizobium]|uniref:ATP-binding protein n=1 Tax=unclassified Bradyrhizobium TaxID=2631580 RepID=UPI0028EDC83B|nr:MULTISPECIES: 4Fe-4S binding protein [unclassified Bradyrhizobium]
MRDSELIPAAGGVPDSVAKPRRSKRANPAKVRKAARHPDRPGTECQAMPGAYVPVVDRNRCEAKGDCVEVCPYDVFDVTAIEPADFRALSFVGRLRVRVHGMKTAYTPRSDRCLACGLCVVACPERAISLVKVAAGEDEDAK